MAKCKVVTVCGRRRKLCFTAKGKIKSNTPASGGGSRKASRKSSSGGGKHKTGFAKAFHCKKKQKGYRWVKGGRCIRAAA